MWHTQQRSDRDDYVKINWKNIEPKFHYAFSEYDTINFAPYDYGSVMHYRPTVCMLAHCEGVSNIITLLRYPVFCISGTSLSGKLGQICFSEFLEIISSFFAQNFCTDRVDILLCSEGKKTGGFSSKFGTLAPSKYCGRQRQARARLRPRRVLRSIISTPMSFFLPRIKFTAWAYGALQRHRRHFLISRPRNTKLTGLIELDESFPTIQNSGVREPPFWRNVGSKSKLWPPISPPPRGLGGQFWYHAMRDL